jgi:CDP-diacylglycerol--glycerol-3-phosphate 3-phosphatidyltransferase
VSAISPSFRTRFRATIERPVAAFFVRTRLTPNMLTLIGFGIAVVGAWLVATQSWLIGGLVVGIGSAFDLFDGALARATGRMSRLGAFMDSVFDRAGEGVVYVGLVVGLATLPPNGLLGASLAAAAMAAAFMVSYTRAKSESLGFSAGAGMAAIGLAPREVRSVILTIGLVAAAFNVMFLIAALGLIAILATVTTIQRILFVYKQSSTQPR